MSIRRRSILFAAIAFLAAGSVYAGGNDGGGSKRNATIKFTNNSSTQVGVTTDANSAAILQALTDASLSEFTAAGGKVLNPGDSQSFSVNTGTYTVGAADLSTAGSATAITGITTTVTAKKGKTTRVPIVNATGTNTIQFGTITTK